MRRTRSILAGALALAVAAIAGPATAEPLKIGLIGPMTGPGAPWGYAARTSMQVAAADVNAKGGLEVGGKRYQVEIVAYDDQYKAAEALAAYNRLVNQDGVKYIIVQTSAPTLAIKQNVEDDKIVTFSTAYTPAILDDKSRFLFRAYSNHVNFVPPFTVWLKDNIMERRLATLNPNDETGWSQQKITEPLYREAGFTVVGSELYERAAKDFLPLLTKAMASTPEIIDLGASSPATAGLIVRQAREMGYKGRFVQTGGPGWVEVVGAAGKEAAEGMINILYADPENPGFRRLADEYRRLNNGQTPNEMIVVYYDALSVMLAAIQKAGTVTDTTTVAAAMSAALPVKGVQGDEMTYATQQVRTWDYIGVLTNGVPKVVGKVK